MEKLVKVVLIASKRSIKKLEFNSPYFCKCLNKNVAITNRFYKHISWYSKNRKTIEIIERLSILSLIEEILLKWGIFQKNL